MKETLNNDILSLFGWFEEADFELYLVGGCVRDYLRHQINNDYDFTTNATPFEIMEILQDKGGSILPTGLKHGTLTFLYHKIPYEITTYRKESSYENHRSPKDVIFVNSLYEDLKRRDFTINAICYHPKKGFVDPFFGQEDLNNQIIRCIGEPKERFNEDALRILRALRFHYTFHFMIEPNTYQAIKSCVPLLSYISKERIQMEWNKMLLSNYPMLLTSLKEAHVLDYICEELQLLEIEQETPWHSYNAFTHTDVVLSNTKNENLVFKLAAVFHDIGKHDTKVSDANGIAHFYGHAAQSILLTKKIMKDLKYSNKIIFDVCELISFHDYHFPAKEKAVRKFLGKLNQNVDFADTILRFQLCDNAGKNQSFIEEQNKTIQKNRDMIQFLNEHESLIQKKDLAINGFDLLELNINEKQISNLLEKSYSYIVLHPTNNNKKDLLKLIKQWI